MTFGEKLNEALNCKVGTKVMADGKEGHVSAKGGSYVDVVHAEGEAPKSYHISKVTVVKGK